MYASPRQYNRRFVSVRPWQLWLAVAALLVIGIGALPAGYSLIRDPSGRSLGFPPGTLNSPLFSNFLVPGLFLFFVNGAGSVAAALALLLRPQWRPLQKVNPFKQEEWTWSLALLMGVIVMAWIVVQLFSVTFTSFLQPLIFALGATVVICMFSSRVRTFLRYN